MNTVPVCAYCGEITRNTKKGANEGIVTRKECFVHVGCYNLNNCVIPVIPMINQEINLNEIKEKYPKLFDIRELPYSYIKWHASNDEYDEYIMKGDKMNRNIILLIVDNKYYFVITNRCAYAFPFYLTNKQIEKGSHYGITWEDPIVGVLGRKLGIDWLDNIDCFGWDYNHTNNLQWGTMVPLEYIYRNISKIIDIKPDHISTIYILLVRELLTQYRLQDLVKDLILTLKNLF